MWSRTTDLPAAAAAVQPAAVQPVAATAAAAAAQPAPPPQPAAAHAPRLVPAVAVAAPSAEELLARLGSRGGNGESTRKRKVNIAATATASILTSATQGDPVAAAELAARVFGSVQVRRALGDQLRQTDSMASFKASLVRHGHHYHLAIKAGKRESALAILSSIVDINDSAEVSTANRLNTTALADLLSLSRSTRSLWATRWYCRTVPDGRLSSCKASMTMAPSISARRRAWECAVVFSVLTRFTPQIFD